MRISDCSSDVCSSDLRTEHPPVNRLEGSQVLHRGGLVQLVHRRVRKAEFDHRAEFGEEARVGCAAAGREGGGQACFGLDGIGHYLRQRPRLIEKGLPGNPGFEARAWGRSEEHTSELQSLMRISYAVFCLKKKKIRK